MERVRGADTGDEASAAALVFTGTPQPRCCSWDLAAGSLGGACMGSKLLVRWLYSM